VGIQFVITILVALLIFTLFTTVAAYSVLLGGFAYILPNAYFIRSAFRGSEQQTPHMILRWLYIGEAGKLVLTGVIFAICFALVKPINVIALFVMYILMIFVNLAGLEISKKRFTGIQ
jgi:ATP synthase protein I